MLVVQKVSLGLLLLTANIGGFVYLPRRHAVTIGVLILNAVHSTAVSRLISIWISSTTHEALEYGVSIAHTSLVSSVKFLPLGYCSRLQ